MASPFSASASFNLNRQKPEDDGNVDGLEGDAWLKRQRELAGQSSGLAGSGPAPSPFKPAVPMAPRVSAIQPAGPMGRATDSVAGRRFGDGSRVEQRGDGSTAIYGEGNRFMGYSGAAIQPAVPGPGQTNLPAVSAISPEAQAGEEKAQAGIAAGNERLASARTNPAVVQRVQSQLDAQKAARVAKVQQLTPEEVARGASIENQGVGPVGTATVQTADGRTVTLSPAQMASREAVRAAIAIPAASQAAAPVVPVSPVVPVPIQAPAASPFSMSRPAPVAAVSSMAPRGPFAPSPMASSVLAQTGQRVASLPADLAAQSEQNRLNRVDLATSGPGGSANSRSIISGVNTSGPMNYSPSNPPAVRGAAQIQAEAPERGQIASRQRAASWDARTAENERNEAGRQAELKKRKQPRVRKEASVADYNAEMAKRANSPFSPAR